MQTITALVFNNFETLDLYGVVEMFGRLPDQYCLQFASVSGGMIHNHHGVTLSTTASSALTYQTDILLIVGGPGTRKLANDSYFLDELSRLSGLASWVLSVCTGSALLAKAGLLDGRQATSNKRAWHWVVTQSAQVHWQPQARWVVDGKFYTSSGVSAGMDMALGFIADKHGIDSARQIAYDIEYCWQEDSRNDEFLPR